MALFVHYALGEGWRVNTVLKWGGGGGGRGLFLYIMLLGKGAGGGGGVMCPLGRGLVAFFEHCAIWEWGWGGADF